MAQIDLTSFDAILKTRYDKAKPESLMFQEQPLHAMLKKKTDFTGKSMVFAVIAGRPSGVSSTFSTAQSNSGAAQYEDFTISLAKYYGVHEIDGLTLNVAKGQEGTFLDGQLEMIDSIYNGVLEQVAIAEYRDGTGAIGARASISTNTITLSKVEDSYNFEKGFVITAASSDNSTARTGSAIVAAVDYSAGTVLVDNASGISSFADGDLLFVSGNRNLGLKGLAAWIPASAPSSTTFFGVDRSTNPSRLGGNRVDGSAKPLQESLVEAAHISAAMGGTPNNAMMSFTRHKELINELGAKVQYLDHNVGSVGFKSLMVQGPRGPIKCIADTRCPNDKIYVLDMSTWELWSAGQVPHIVQNDGLRIQRKGTSDAYEVRVAAYVQLVCKAPGFNTVVNL